MSKLVSKLQLLSKSATTPIGFRSSVEPRKATMLLIAGLSKADPAEAKILADIGVDAALMVKSSINKKAIKQVIEVLDNVPLGVLMEDASQETLSQTLTLGLDFIVFDKKMPIGILQQEGIGRFLFLEPSLDLGAIRAANQLEIDGAFLATRSEGSSITVEHLLNYRRVIDLLDKPVVVSLPFLIDAAGLNVLWQLGVDGIVIPPDQPADLLAKLRDMIAGLPKRTMGRASKAGAVLPRLDSFVAGEEEEEEEV